MQSDVAPYLSSPSSWRPWDISWALSLLSSFTPNNVVDLLQFPDIYEEEAILRFLSELLIQLGQNALPTCTHLRNIESLWEIWLGPNDGFQFDFMNGLYPYV